MLFAYLTAFQVSRAVVHCLACSVVRAKMVSGGTWTHHPFAGDHCTLVTAAPITLQTFLWNRQEQHEWGQKQNRFERLVIWSHVCRHMRFKVWTETKKATDEQRPTVCFECLHKARSLSLFASKVLVRLSRLSHYSDLINITSQVCHNNKELLYSWGRFNEKPQVWIMTDFSHCKGQTNSFKVENGFFLSLKLGLDTSSLFKTDQTNSGSLRLSSLMDKLFPFIEAPGPFYGRKTKGRELTACKVFLPLLIMMIPSAAARENWIFFTGGPEVYMELKNSCFPKVTNGIESCCAGLSQAVTSRSIGTI